MFSKYIYYLGLQIIHSGECVQFEGPLVRELFAHPLDVLADFLLLHLLHADDFVLFVG